MDILDELKLGPEPATDPAAKARIEAALGAYVPHRQPRRARIQTRTAAIAVAVLMLGGAALAATSPWQDEQQGWSSMTAPVSHDPSTMVLGAVPELLHCTGSLADCTTEGGGTGDHPVIFLFRAGEAPSTTVDHRAELGPVTEATVAAPAFRIWTNGSAPRDPALDPVSCTPTDTGWPCSQIDPDTAVPAGTPIYVPQSETTDRVYWAWGTPSPGGP